MKWHDTTPLWRPQPLASLQARAGRLWPELLDDAGLAPLLSVPRELPVARTLEPWLLVEQPALRTVIAHLGSVSHEQGGLLLGHAFGVPTDDGASTDDGAPTDDDLRSENGDNPAGADTIVAIAVTEALASVDFDASAVSLRMESRLWDQARERLDSSAEIGLLVIGWYHSHPDLGAFFSGTDQRTQAAFFAHPYSVGWVIDPIRGEHACYLGKHSTAIASDRILLQRKSE